MAMASVSVIIPTYNRAHLVAEAIQSVLNQTFTDFELIVVDDGSTDNTEETVCSFADSRLKYYRQPNKGVASARNRGLQACTSEYVAYLDSDDLFLPERLSLQMARVVESPEVGLVYGQYYSSGPTESLMKLRGTCYPQLELRDLLFGTVFHWSTVLISRSLLEHVGGFDEQFPVGEEWELTLRLALAGCRMACVPEPVAVVRQQPNSLAKTSHRHEDALMAVLVKTFSNPQMPSDLSNLRTMALGSQLVRIAASAYVTSDLEMGCETLQRALEACPSFTDEHIDFFVETLVYRIRGLSIEDPAEVLRRVTEHLPGNRRFSRRLKPELWAKFHEIAAFQAYQSGERAKCIGYAIRAVGQMPSKLRNRGLVSILAQSLLANIIGLKTAGPTPSLPTKDRYD